MISRVVHSLLRNRTAGAARAEDAVMDTTGLSCAADRIDSHAEVLRGRARLLALHRDSVRWQSPAARICRSRIDAVTADLLAGAARAAEVAERLRLHAARIRAAS
jgi:hypothetical protein